MRTISVLLLILTLSTPIVYGKQANRSCTTNRNAPPSNSYYWPPNAIVKVYFVRHMFTSEQRQIMSAAMFAWTAVAREAGANVKFVNAGESQGVNYCTSCLTVSRREVYKPYRKHYAFFYPLRQDRKGLLVSARIDFDFAITRAKALRGFMSHELGHGMGLWDCLRCGKKQTIMNGFQDVNRDNGLIAPSPCDLDVVRQVYAVHKRSSAATEKVASGVR